jgi:hypothetical protein
MGNLELSSYQASMIIKDAEIRIADAMKKATELEPQVKEYFAAYSNLNDELISTKKKIDEDRALLEMASRSKNQINGNRKFRVLRAESHNEMKPKEQRKLGRTNKYHWVEWAQEALEKIGKPARVDELWDAVVQLHPIERNANYRKIRWGAINACWGTE